ncbi:hypothetical protein GobsT_13130 [Gemmata obscuriglobus]|nr:hypothetical protein GobsT_13130 [Gemmata obscuriglobus]VTS02003.1 Bacillolysin OS=Bacillus cereus BDRD-ST24 GN=bcere0012_19670 PE=4 SV=1: PepSY: Peptidase_MA_2 [Gemmata obscuriglobus UQM 2246]
MRNRLARLVQPGSVKSTPRFICDDRIGPKRGGARETAEDFLTAWAARLKIDTRQTPLGYDRVLSSRFGKHVLFQQRFRGKRLSHAWLRVDLDPDGHVVAVSNRCLTAARAKRAGQTCPHRAVLSADQAVDHAVRSVGSAEGVAATRDPKLTYLRAGPGVHRTWSVDLAGADPADRWRVYVDVVTGRVIHSEEQVLRATGSGLIFSPNPMVALGAPGLSPADPIPSEAYREVALLDLDDSGFLTGPWVTTEATSAAARIRRPSGDFRVTRENTGFREVMAYYHIDTAQRYLQSIGMAHAAVRVSVDASGSGSGAFFDPNTLVVTLSTGGTPDAEDAEVILHEYGHAVQNAIVFGFGQAAASRPLAEGTADYFAATFFDGVKGGAFRRGLGSWEAAGDGQTGSPPFSRVLDFHGPLGGQPLRLTEFWSGCLWSLRELFGRTRADTLAVGFLSFVPHDGGLADGAISLVAVNRLLIAAGTADRDSEAAIVEMFWERGVDARQGSIRSDVDFPPLPAVI